jgi:hypothetical protein
LSRLPWRKPSATNKTGWYHGWEAREIVEGEVMVCSAQCLQQIFIQGIGYVALLFVVLSVQNKKRASILLFLTVAMLLFMVQYGLLHAWSGAVMNAIGAIRTVIFSQKGNKAWARHPIWVVFFLLAFLTAGIATWVSYYSVLPILATWFDTIALWKENAQSVRGFLLLPRPFWFSYNVFVGSYAGITAELFLFTSIVVGMIRFDRPQGRLWFWRRGPAQPENPVKPEGTPGTP